VKAGRQKPRRKKAPCLAVLSRKKSLYSTRRLLEAAKARGFRTRVIDVLRCNLHLEANEPRLFHKGREVRGLSVALPRIGASVTVPGLAVVRQLQALKVPLVNGASAIAKSRDKLTALQELATAGVRIPRTVLARGGGDVKDLVAQVGGLPAILKLIQGTQGVGVMIAHSEAEVTSILGTLWDLGQEILLQEFVAEANGRDLRALVVGDRVVGAMRRSAKRGEFRSNLHRGGAGSAVELPQGYAEAAVRAARVLGLDVAGVDLLESSEGPTVLELNSSPGFEGLERATGLDIAAAIVEEAMRKSEGGARPPRPGKAASGRPRE
jgi:ribosomal protein S6--L-glutamate ligase